MQVDGWNLPIYPPGFYQTLWSKFLNFQGKRSIHEWVRIAEQLCDQHGGYPTRKWLLSHGLSGLTNCRLKNPSQFAHLPPSLRVRLPLHERVQQAETLAQQHGGCLPHAKYLARHYPAIYGGLQAHPDSFAHIRIKKRLKSLTQIVQEAEQLAYKHHGILPNRAYLQTHHWRIYKSLLQSPSAFQHIPQLRLDSKGRPIVDAVDPKELRCES